MRNMEPLVENDEVDSFADDAVVQYLMSGDVAAGEKWPDPDVDGNGAVFKKQALVLPSFFADDLKRRDYELEMTR